MSIETPPEGFQKELEPGKEPNEIPKPTRSRNFRRRSTTSDSNRVWTLVETSPLEDSRLKRWWRPFMAWQYILVCLFDFIIAPILTMVFFQGNETSYVQWVPLTIQNGGLYHLSMGAIMGIYTWSRGQEKMSHIEK